MNYETAKKQLDQWHTLTRNAWGQREFVKKIWYQKMDPDRTIIDIHFFWPRVGKGPFFCHRKWEPTEEDQTAKDWMIYDPKYKKKKNFFRRVKEFFNPPSLC